MKRYLFFWYLIRKYYGFSIKGIRTIMKTKSMESQRARREPET